MEIPSRAHFSYFSFYFEKIFKKTKKVAPGVLFILGKADANENESIWLPLQPMSRARGWADFRVCFLCVHYVERIFFAFCFSVRPP